MTNPNPKDVEASVKSRLLNLARRQRQPFQELLQYYSMERFLYRLSLTDHVNRFVLKGALLIKVWNIHSSRATQDIDLLAHGSNAPENLKQTVEEICLYQSILNDGIVFDATSIKASIMQTQRKYHGARLKFLANLGSARIPMQIDVGFSDIVTPKPEDITYPALLDYPAPKLKGYTTETVIAEKLQTMIERGMLNSRIKDIYDVWLLIKQRPPETQSLLFALQQTFRQRSTPFRAINICSVISQYASNPQAQQLWKSLRLKSGLSPNCPDCLTDMAQEIISFLHLAFDLTTANTKPQP